MSSEEQLTNYENQQVIQAHIQKLFNEADLVKLNSTHYWQLRATYLEKSLDPTYSQEERDHCAALHYRLTHRTK